jgi:hypothetical protein
LGCHWLWAAWKMSALGLPSVAFGQPLGIVLIHVLAAVGKMPYRLLLPPLGCLQSAFELSILSVVCLWPAFGLAFGGLGWLCPGCLGASFGLPVAFCWLWAAFGLPLGCQGTTNANNATVQCCSSRKAAATNAKINLIRSGFPASAHDHMRYFASFDELRGPCVHVIVCMFSQCDLVVVLMFAICLFREFS